MHQAEVQRREESVVIPNRQVEFSGSRAGGSRERPNRPQGANSSRASSSRTGASERRPRVLPIPQHVSYFLNVCLFECYKTFFRLTLFKHETYLRTLIFNTKIQIEQMTADVFMMQCSV